MKWLIRLETLVEKVLNTEHKQLWTKRCGNVFIYIAAVSVACSVEFASRWEVFLLYTLGSTFWLLIGLALKDRQLAQLNAVFIILDLYGIYIRI